MRLMKLFAAGFLACVLGAAIGCSGEGNDGTTQAGELNVVEVSDSGPNPVDQVGASEIGDEPGDCGSPEDLPTLFPDLDTQGGDDDSAFPDVDAGQEFVPETCVEEGNARSLEEIQALGCCDGLIAVLDYNATDDGNCSWLFFPPHYICIKCGDSVCSSFESWCHCPEDCSESNGEG